MDRMVDTVADRVHEGLDHGREWTDRRISEVERALDAGKGFMKKELETVTGSTGGKG